MLMFFLSRVALVFLALGSIYAVSPPCIVVAALAVGYWLTLPAVSPPAAAATVGNFPAVETLAAPRVCKVRTLSSRDIGEPRRLFDPRVKTGLTSRTTSGNGDVFPHLTTSFQTSNVSSLRGCMKSKSKRKKKVKRVVIAEERNTYKEVQNWIVRQSDQHDLAKPITRHVHWDVYDVVYEFEPYWDNDGAHSQLHFPRTKFIRNVPDIDLEDFDGDIEMLDV
ncbi:MAG: hypothetical protein Q9163_006042 [Psora crenata]